MDRTSRGAAVAAFVLAGAAGLWWASDRTAPVIADLAFDRTQDHVYRGELVLGIAVSDDRTGVAVIEVHLDGEEIVRAPDGTVRIPPSIPDGDHQLRVYARDRRGNAADLQGSFRTDNTAPSLQLARSSQSGAQGRASVLLVKTDEPLRWLRVRVLGGSRELHQVGPSLWRGVLGISSDLEPGVQKLTLQASDPAGNETMLEADLVIAETDFPRGGMINLTPAQVEARTHRPGVDAANRRRREAYATDVDIDPWSGPFAMPVQGAILSSPFGKVRDYSDGGVSRHLGTDYAAPLGTPVTAPADGVVVLAEEMSIYGLVIILKHGPETATSYNHLSEMLVNPGDAVARGTLIARVGSTGQSTGPHLHWGMNVGGSAVAAEQWIEDGFGLPREDDFD
jgi:murein DD-endopeptidase MepM/ murein hydrolase activator NlpD